MKHYHYSKISSTNDLALQLLKTDSPVLVTADYQLNGRGRQNRNWSGNSRDNVYCSLGISHTPAVVPSGITLYQAIGSLAVKYSLQEATGADIFILKYPNDVIIRTGSYEYRKISGTLVENGFLGSLCLYSVIGIGINVKQETFEGELSDKATSLKLLGYDFEPEDMLKLLLKNLDILLGKSKDILFGLWKSELNI